MFYVDCGDCQLVGASPETLCKIEAGKVAVHAIAGTVKRGANDEEDAELSFPAGKQCQRPSGARHVGRSGT